MHVHHTVSGGGSMLAPQSSCMQHCLVAQHVEPVVAMHSGISHDPYHHEVPHSISLQHVLLLLILYRVAPRLACMRHALLAMCALYVHSMRTGSDVSDPRIHQTSRDQVLS